MDMGFTCSICQELFDGSESVVATPCGHIFHAECVTQWLNRSTTCPECRRYATRGSLQKLYFNSTAASCETTDMSGLLNQIGELTTELKDKDKIILDYKKEQRALKVTNLGLADQHVRGQQRLISLQRSMQFLNNLYGAEIRKNKLNLEIIDNLKIKILKLESHNRLLTTQLKTLDIIKHIVDDSDEEVALVLKGITEGAATETNTALLTSCALLKHKLARLADEKTEMRAIILELRKKLDFVTECEALATNRIEELGTENIEMKSAMSNLQQKLDFQSECQKTINDRIEELDAEKTRMRSYMLKLQKQLFSKSASEKRAISKTEALVVERKEMRSTVAMLRKQLRVRSGSAKQATSRIKDLVVEVTEMKSVVKKMEQQLGLKSENEKQASDRIKELETRVKYFERRYMNMSSKLDLDMSANIEGGNTSARVGISSKADFMPPGRHSRISVHPLITIDFNCGK